MSKFSQVQKQQKQLPYTVSMIGDEVALKHWKEYRAQVDAQYRAEASLRFQDRRANAVDFVSNQDANPFKYTEAEREELAVRKARLEAARARLCPPDTLREAILATPKVPPTLFARIKNFFSF